MTFFVIHFFLSILVSPAQSIGDSLANPLISKRAPAPQTNAKENVPAPGIFSDLISKIAVLQIQLKQKIAANVNTFKSSGTFAPLLPLFLLSFFYGVVHAAGPGHGKAIAMSYTLAEGKGYRSGLLLGTMIAIIHAGSAIVIIVSLRFLLEKSINTNLDTATQATQFFSYGLIVLIGLYLFWTRFFSLIKGTAFQNKEYVGHRHIANPFTAALAIGLIPCPGVIMILLFCLSLEQFFLGVLLSMAVSLGMALTISVSVWICITGKKFTLLVTGNTQQGFYYTEHVLSCISGLLLILLGGVFLAASFSL